MQEYMEKYAAPGEHHNHLALLAGQWATKTQFWPAPGAPVMESTGTAEHKMALGGRYLLTSLQTSGFMGQPYAGMGMVAYDRFLEKYVETWCDTMGTMMLVSSGTCGGAGKQRAMVAEFVDPMTKKPTRLRSLYNIHDPNHYTLEMFTLAPDGNEFKIMEIAHARR